MHAVPPDALQLALRWLARRDRTSHEIRSRLRDKGCTASEVNEVVRCLRDKGLLSDRRFAARWIQERLRCRPASRSAMTRQLRQKGLHPEVIAEQMDHCYPVSDERPAAVEVARRHASRYRRHDPDTARRRLYAVLARRGFSPSDCRAALEIAGPDSTRDSG